MVQKEKSHKIPPNEEVHGRTDNTGDPRMLQRFEDISLTDMCEGNNNPGETGGNFQATSSDIQEDTAGDR